MNIDRGPKVDNKLLRANTMLLDKNKALQYDVEILEKKIQEIEEFCEVIEECYPDCKSFASRILFILKKEQIF